MAGKLDMGHARALLGARGRVSRRRPRRAWSRRACRCARPSGSSISLAHPGKAQREARRAPLRIPTSRALPDELAETLGAKVTIEPKAQRRRHASSSATRASSSSTDPRARRAPLAARGCARARASRLAASDAAACQRPTASLGDAPFGPARRAASPASLSPAASASSRASETSYLPGASMLSAFTTPSSTSIEKRWQRTPMPRAVEIELEAERLRVVGAAVAHHPDLAARSSGRAPTRPSRTRR